MRWQECDLVLLMAQCFDELVTPHPLGFAVQVVVIEDRNAVTQILQDNPAVGMDGRLAVPAVHEVQIGVHKYVRLERIPRVPGDKLHACARGVEAAVNDVLPPAPLGQFRPEVAHCLALEQVETLVLDVLNRSPFRRLLDQPEARVALPCCNLYDPPRALPRHNVHKLRVPARAALRVKSPE